MAQPRMNICTQQGSSPSTAPPGSGAGLQLEPTLAAAMSKAPGRGAEGSWNVERHQSRSSRVSSVFLGPGVHTTRALSAPPRQALGEHWEAGARSTFIHMDPCPVGAHCWNEGSLMGKE